MRIGVLYPTQTSEAVPQFAPPVGNDTELLIRTIASRDWLKSYGIRNDNLYEYFEHLW